MNSRTIRFSLIFLLVMGLMAALISCGGSSSSSTDTTTDDTDYAAKMQLSGLLATPSKTAKEPVAQVNVAFDPDAVWAIPVAKLQGSSIAPFNLALKIVALVDPDTGSFTLDLPKYFSYEDILVVEPSVATVGSPGDYFEVDWLLLIMDRNYPIAFVELADATSELSLTLFPVTKSAADAALALGDIYFDGEAALSLGDAAASFTLTIDQLLSIARADDVFKSIKNMIRNADFSTTPPRIAQGKTHFVFGDFTLLGTSANTDFSAPENLVADYSGYQLSFDLNDYYADDGTLICLADSRYTLTPPGDVTVMGITYGAGGDASHKLMNTGLNDVGTTISDGEEYCFKSDTTATAATNSNINIFSTTDTTTTTNEWGLEFITGDTPSMLADVLPEGNWWLNKAGETDHFYFDFAVSKPVDTDLNPLIFIPAMRFDHVVDPALMGGGEITNVYVKWLQWDSGTSAYVDADQTVLATMLGNFEIGVMDENALTGDPPGSRRYDHIHGITNFAETNPLDVSNLEGNGPFYYDPTYYADPSTDYRVDYIGISYQLGGSNFRFVWRELPVD